MIQDILKRTPWSSANNQKESINELDSISNRIIRNINKTTKTLINKLKPMLRKQNSILPFGISKESKDRKKSKALRKGQYGTLSLSIFSWVIAIVTGGTAMMLDINSASYQEFGMRPSLPSSFLSCSNGYLNQLGARYSILIITVKTPYLNI